MNFPARKIPHLLVGAGTLLTILTFSRRASRTSQKPITPVLGGFKYTGHLSDAFFEAVEDMARSFRDKGAKLSALDFLAVMWAESGIRPTAYNPSGASGLNQLMPDNMPGVGWTGTSEAYRSLSAVDQLPYARRFWEQKKVYPYLTDKGRLYLLNIAPAHIGKPDSFPVYKTPSQEYLSNKSLDVEGKGYISVGDTYRFVEARMKPDVENELRYRLQRLGVQA